MLKVTLESLDSESPGSRFRIADSVPLRSRVENLLISCKKENPENPTSEFPLKQEIDKYPENTRKIPKMRNLYFLSFRGGGGASEKLFRGAPFLCVGGGIFEFLGVPIL